MVGGRGARGFGQLATGCLVWGTKGEAEERSRVGLLRRHVAPEHRDVRGVVSAVLGEGAQPRRWRGVAVHRNGVLRRRRPGPDGEGQEETWACIFGERGAELVCLSRTAWPTTPQSLRKSTFPPKQQDPRASTSVLLVARECFLVQIVSYCVCLMCISSSNIW